MSLWASSWRGRKGVPANTKTTSTRCWSSTIWMLTRRWMPTSMRPISLPRLTHWGKRPWHSGLPCVLRRRLPHSVQDTHHRSQHEPTAKPVPALTCASAVDHFGQSWRRQVVSMEQKTIETRPWDVAEHLETDEDMAAYLDAALEDGDAAVVVAALGDIARKRNGADCPRSWPGARVSTRRSRRLATQSLPQFLRWCGRSACSSMCNRHTHEAADRLAVSNPCLVRVQFCQIG